jgi:hypothetical protein
MDWPVRLFDVAPALLQLGAQVHASLSLENVVDGAVSRTETPTTHPWCTLVASPAKWRCPSISGLMRDGKRVENCPGL